MLGIANMHDLKKLGRVGGKALLYFEIVLSRSLAIGLIVVNVMQPGDGLDVARARHGDVSSYVAAGKIVGFVAIVTHIVPAEHRRRFRERRHASDRLLRSPLRNRDHRNRRTAPTVIAALDALAKIFFRIIAIVMRVAPIGAFGAMAYTVGAFGIATLLPLGRLMLCVYVTMALFIFVVLNAIARVYGFSLWSYLKFIREEILIVLGTSSSEAALPQLLEKMERYGCAKSVVGLVIPAGYSFNLDGTSIYLSMASIFIAQAFDVHLSITQQLSLLAVLMITSKGAAGVTGSGFIVLASTLAAVRVVPIEGIALVLGVDRFMSEARAITNLIGNGVATLVVAESENAFDDDQRKRAVAELRLVRGSA